MGWIIALIIVIFTIVLLRWMWHNLGNIEKSTKMTCIVGGLIVVYILTFIIYSVSKIGIVYENTETKKILQTVFVPLFTIVNSYIILPYVFKKLNQINNEEIGKEKVKKSIIILLVVIVILGIFESSYLGNVQENILNIINKN